MKLTRQTVIDSVRYEIAERDALLEKIINICSDISVKGIDTVKGEISVEQRIKKSRISSHDLESLKFAFSHFFECNAVFEEKANLIMRFE